MKTTILFGAGADLDATDNAVPGDRLLLNTFRQLNHAKQHDNYLKAFAELFGNEPKASYSWKGSVGDMIRRKLRHSPERIMADGDDDQTLELGQISVPIAPRFMAFLQAQNREHFAARRLVFHIVIAIYGAAAANRLQAAAANTIQQGFNDAQIDIPRDLYDEFELEINYDPERQLIESAKAATEQVISAEVPHPELEAILVRLFDYAVVFDQVFGDLTTDRDQIGKADGKTAPLRKAVHFLFALKLATEQMSGEAGSDSYYHRLPNDAAVFTMNYTPLLGNIMSQNGVEPAPIYIHGQSSELFDIRTGELNPESGGIPFLMPQTSTKPIAAVETIRRFSAFLSALAESSHIVTVGYGFNGDDDHVTNMIFDALNQNPSLRATILVKHTPDGSAGMTRLTQRFGNRVEVEVLPESAEESRDRFSEIVRQ